MRGKLEGVARIACQNANFVPNIVFTSHRTDSILDMVTNQACVALLMDVHVQLPENGPRPSYSPWRAIPSDLFTAVPVLPQRQTSFQNSPAVCGSL